MPIDFLSSSQAAVDYQLLENRYGLLRYELIARLEGRTLRGNVTGPGFLAYSLSQYPSAKCRPEIVRQRFRRVLQEHEHLLLPLDLGFDPCMFQGCSFTFDHGQLVVESIDDPFRPLCGATRAAVPPDVERERERLEKLRGPSVEELALLVELFFFLPIRIETHSLGPFDPLGFQGLSGQHAGPDLVQHASQLASVRTHPCREVVSEFAKKGFGAPCRKDHAACRVHLREFLLQRAYVFDDVERHILLLLPEL